LTGKAPFFRGEYPQIEGALPNLPQKGFKNTGGNKRGFCPQKGRGPKPPKNPRGKRPKPRVWKRGNPRG